MFLHQIRIQSRAVPARGGFCPSRAGHIVALAIVTLLGMVIQPCLASMPDAPSGMEDCHHAGECPEMRAADCSTDAVFSTGVLRGGDSNRAVALPVLLPVDSLGADPRRLTDSTRWPPASGPPLNIRLCNLRN